MTLMFYSFIAYETCGGELVLGFKVLLTHARSPQEEQRKDGNDSMIRK